MPAALFARQARGRAHRDRGGGGGQLLPGRSSRRSRHRPQQQRQERQRRGGVRGGWGAFWLHEPAYDMACLAGLLFCSHDFIESSKRHHVLAKQNSCIGQEGHEGWLAVSVRLQQIQKEVGTVGGLAMQTDGSSASKGPRAGANAAGCTTPSSVGAAPLPPVGSARARGQLLLLAFALLSHWISQLAGTCRQQEQRQVWREPLARPAFLAAEPLLFDGQPLPLQGLQAQAEPVHAGGTCRGSAPPSRTRPLTGGCGGWGAPRHAAWPPAPRAHTSASLLATGLSAAGGNRHRRVSSKCARLG